MSVEDRVERIKAEREEAINKRSELKTQKLKEFPEMKKLVHYKLEKLRELGVVGIIEAFTKSKVSPIFISENKPFPDLLPKEWWSAKVLHPELNNQTLEWDTNLRIKIEQHYPPDWVDFVWFDNGLISVSGQEETYKGNIPTIMDQRISTIEEAIAQAVVNPKQGALRTRIGSHA